MAIKIQHSIRTLRLKVKTEGYTWLNKASIGVNDVWNYANATSYKAARPFSGPSKWLTAFALNNLTAGATEHFAVAQVPALRDAVGLDLGLKETVATSDGDKLQAGHFYRSIERKILSAQRRGHKRQAKRLHRTAARRRKDVAEPSQTYIRCEAGISEMKVAA